MADVTELSTNETDQSKNTFPIRRGLANISRRKLLVIIGAIILLGILSIVVVFGNKTLLGKEAEKNFLKYGTVILKPKETVNYFSVVSVTPDANSKGNAADAPITITFSEPVKPGSLRSFFTVSPMIPGTFSQGDKPNKVVFKAKYPYGEGTSVRVILNKGFESVSGDKFIADYTYNFYTKTPDNAVSFQSSSMYSRWVNLAIGKTITFTMDVGDAVSPDSTITVYKGTFDEIVSSLLYKSSANEGTSYISQTFLNYPVDTTTMAKVSQTKGIANNAKYTFKQPEGLYYIEVKSNNSVVGSTWINVTNEGIIVRQDDQKIIVATQNITTGDTTTPVKILLYNLQDKPTLLAVSQVNSYGEIPVQYPQTVDLVVGQTANGVVLAPVSIPETQADIRVTSNLSSLDKIYISTDKPTYISGDSVKFSGILREDNDAKYSLSGSGRTVRLWIPDPKDSSQNVIDQIVSVDSHGIFSGQFVVPASLVPSANATSPSVTIYAKEVKDGATYFSSRSFTTFDVVAQKDKAVVSVSFAKQHYLKNETVKAHITASDASGKPLANQTVSYVIYSKDYFENDPRSVASFGTDFGEPTKDGNKQLTLDKNGTADVTLNKIDSAASQAVTLQATMNINNQNVSGARTVLIQQGNAVLSFGPSRQNYHNGDTTISRVYAHDLSGKPLVNAPLQYTIYSSTYQESTQQYKETVLYQGNVSTDQDGYALISQVVKTQSGGVTLRVTTTDETGNAVQAERSMIVSNQLDSGNIYYHDLELINLDVSTDKLAYTVGDTATLSITSPFEQKVLITLESGRIYQSEWVQLHTGANSYSIPITATLSPSFNVVFSYFRGENLYVEGLPLTVNDASKALQVSITTDKNLYSTSDTAQITITTKDSTGTPVSANLLVNAIDNSIFGLRDIMPSGDIGWYYYKPRQDTINSSASTLGIGTGGGCGGGSGFDTAYVPNHLGNTIYWNPNLSTDQNGQLTLSVPLSVASGDVRVLVTAVTDATAVKQTQTVVQVQ